MSTRKITRVREVMHSKFQMVDGLMTLQQALRIFKQDKVSALMINKRDADDEFGMLLLSDIAKEVLAKDRSPERVSVYEIMAKPVLSVSPEMDIRYCARLFENFGLSYAPVIDDGEIIGLVSYAEIVLEGLVDID